MRPEGRSPIKIDESPGDPLVSYSYLFGPVPSRRLGLSLGVDLLPPKTCSLNCVYCECGATTHLTVKRGELVPTAEVCGELSRRLGKPPEPEWVTFAGSGEPTLHTGLGEIAGHIRKTAPKSRIAVLTNGTLFTDPEVRADCARADLVAVSVDAAGPEAFRMINRPHPSLDVGAILSGIEAFRREYGGLLWAEIFLIPGVNDSEGELYAIRDAVSRIGFDEVQLNCLDRPGTEAWVAKPSQDELSRAAGILNAKIIGKARGRAGSGEAAGDPAGLVLEAAKRRPLTDDDVSRIIRSSVEEARCLLDGLVKKGLLVARPGERGLFYGVSGG